MYCTECGRNLEDHEFENHQFATQELDFPGGTAFDYHNLDIIEYTAPCDVCKKNLFDHPVHCRYCGRVFCRKHAKPKNHACQNIPPPPPPPPQPVYSAGEKLAAGLGLLVQIIIIMIGIVVVVWGWGIAMDNRSGHNVTFPFAGMITSMIGFVIIAIGIRFRVVKDLLGFQ